MSDLKIPFGLLGDKLVSPSEVTNGLKCNCICPGCKKPLVANHPKSINRRKYFSHYKKSNCSSGYQTALHLAAIQIISEALFILVPNITAQVTVEDFETNTIVTIKKSISEQYIKLACLEKEPRSYPGFIPDIAIRYDEKPFLIEVCVTNPVDDLKLEKLKRFGCPVLQINLNPTSQLPTMEELKRLVLHTKENREWIIEPRLFDLFQLAKQEAEAELLLKKARAISKVKNESFLSKLDSSLNNLDQIKSELEMLDLNWASRKYVIQNEIDINDIFSLKSALLQLMIYKSFIHKKIGSSFNREDVLNLISKFNSSSELFSSVNMAPVTFVHRYLEFLGELGLINRVYSNMYVVEWNVSKVND